MDSDLGSRVLPCRMPRGSVPVLIADLVVPPDFFPHPPTIDRERFRMTHVITPLRLGEEYSRSRFADNAAYIRALLQRQSARRVVPVVCTSLSSIEMRFAADWT
jgi:hypothetical protein